MMKREEKKKADDEEKKRLEAVPTIPEDGASGAGGSAVSGEHAQNEVVTTFTFQVGDIVMGHAKKKKGNYDMQECRITAVLAKQYKVLMTSGAATGTDHKYLHEDVSAIAIATAPSDAAAEDANTQPGIPSVMLRDGSEPTQLQPDAASGSTKVEAESQPLDDVF